MTCRWRDSAVAILALLAAAAGGSASAADLSDDSFLRGSLSGGPVRWDGVLLGAQIGYTNMNADFQDATSLVPLSNTTTSSTSYGGFLGYNVQWDELVVGVEGVYTRPSSLETSSQGSAHGVLATSSVKLIDYATLRARAGYAFGQFLPYAFVGGAVGRIDHSTVVAGTVTANRDNAIDAGFTAGLGMDVAIMPNVFVRGEWEFVAFAQVSGVRVTTNTARVGLGVRF